MKPTPTEDGVVIRLRWMERNKKWMLTIGWFDGTRRQHVWRYVDTQVPMDTTAVALIEHHIASLMESWLF